MQLTSNVKITNVRYYKLKTTKSQSHKKSEDEIL